MPHLASSKEAFTTKAPLKVLGSHRIHEPEHAFFQVLSLEIGKGIGAGCTHSFEERCSLLVFPLWDDKRIARASTTRRILLQDVTLDQFLNVASRGGL